MQVFTKTGACARAVFVVCLAIGPAYAATAQVAQPAQGAAGGGAEPQDTRKVDVNEYLVRGNTVLDNQTIEKIVYPYLGPGRTMADIEAARDALQNAYREKGYQSVYVDLPQQQVSGGVVILAVAETKIGRVRVVGAKNYSPLEIRDQVPALQEGEVPDFSKAQSQLTALNRTPDRQVMPVVREGKMPGTMDVDLKVQDKSPWTGSLGVNNDHSAETSTLRTVATLGYNNLWQRGHAFSVTFFTAPQDVNNAKVWSASYTMPLSNRWSMQFSGYHSDSNVATIGGTNVLGKGYSLGMSATYAFDPAGNWTNSFTAGIDYKRFNEALSLGGTSDTAPIRYVPFTFSYNGYRYTEDAQTSLGLSLVTATRSFFNRTSNASQFDYKRFEASPSFALLKGDVSHTQSLPKDWQLFGRVSTQLASGALVSNEQFAAGGATSVRGYLAAERTADDGALGSVELRTPSLARYVGSNVNEWRLYAFSDVAWLRLRDPLPEQMSTYHLASVGLGTRMQVLDWLSGSLDFGYPLVDGPNTPKHHPRLNFNLRASF